MSNPRIQHIAQTAVHIADFVNQWWVRGLLITLGITILIWAWRPFWRLRHKLVFWGRKLVAEQVWISREAALNLMAESAWGRIKEPTTVITSGLLSGFQKTEITSGLTEGQKSRVKFREFLRRTLDLFLADNPTATRMNEGKAEVDEVALRAFLDLAIEDEIVDEFGEIPRHKVV